MLTAMAGLAATGPVLSAPARGVEVSFYFPVAVGGAVANLMGRLVDDFEREHPDIRVRPIYAGTYQGTLTKALTGHKSGTPPDLAVGFPSSCHFCSFMLSPTRWSVLSQ